MVCWRSCNFHYSQIRISSQVDNHLCSVCLVTPSKFRTHHGSVSNPEHLTLRILHPEMTSQSRPECKLMLVPSQARLTSLRPDMAEKSQVYKNSFWTSRISGLPNETDRHDPAWLPWPLTRYAFTHFFSRSPCVLAILNGKYYTFQCSIALWTMVMRKQDNFELQKLSEGLLNIWPIIAPLTSVVPANIQPEQRVQGITSFGDTPCMVLTSLCLEIRTLTEITFEQQRLSELRTVLQADF